MSWRKLYILKWKFFRMLFKATFVFWRKYQNYLKNRKQPENLATVIFDEDYSYLMKIAMFTYAVSLQRSDFSLTHSFSVLRLWSKHFRQPNPLFLHFFFFSTSLNGFVFVFSVRLELKFASFEVRYPFNTHTKRTFNQN